MLNRVNRPWWMAESSEMAMAKKLDNPSNSTTKRCLLPTRSSKHSINASADSTFSKKDRTYYVCDVNGWSFVKKSVEFYSQCARLLREMFLTAMHLNGFSLSKHVPGVMELRGLVAVFRHADRTPKQKLKIKTKNQDILQFFKSSRKEVKLKNDNPKQQAELGKLLEISRKILESNPDSEEAQKISLLQKVLQEGFDGTKVQIKPLEWIFQDEIQVEKVSKALLVCKWGGVLTHTGTAQSRWLGDRFSSFFLPNELKNELRNGAEFFSNSERRVKRTAEEFAKGFLGKDDVSNVIKEDEVLGDTAAGKELMEKTKEELQKAMHSSKLKEYVDVSAEGLKRIGDPLKTMKEIYKLMSEVIQGIDDHGTFCEKEDVTLVKQRWQRLYDNFYNTETNMFDTTKIPDVFDYVTYDVIHNRNSVFANSDQHPLYQKAEALARFVVPEEYGIQYSEKFDIGSLICGNLLEKVFADLSEICQTKSPKARFYFSSESHLHTLRNLLVHSNVSQFLSLTLLDTSWELNYLTNLVFKVFENITVPEGNPSRFKIEVSFSSGTTDPLGIVNRVHTQRMKAMICINNNLTLPDFSKIVSRAHERREQLILESQLKSPTPVRVSQ
eukprot:TRINITY_DN1398_c0_g1_i2.p1 TRINITY_DN1398_c0_g1~~TRINITY_DN1398_c0_g1_i2.p1  ORF type:complete len:612 (+),score=225.32 TRINITY_DN1398_c0_g1_i2:736-2571(+)